MSCLDKEFLCYLHQSWSYMYTFEKLEVPHRIWDLPRISPTKSANLLSSFKLTQDLQNQQLPYFIKFDIHQITILCSTKKEKTCYKLWYTPSIVTFTLISKMLNYDLRINKTHCKNKNKTKKNVPWPWYCNIWGHFFTLSYGS